MKRKYKYIKVFDKSRYLKYLKETNSPSDYMIERELNEEFFEYCDQKDVRYLINQGYDIDDKWCKRKRYYYI